MKKYKLAGVKSNHVIIVSIKVISSFDLKVSVECHISFDITDIRKYKV